MARRVTPAQFRSQLQRAQQQRRQAINKLNNDIRRYNQAVTNYNNAARQHNARVRANRDRLRRELARLNSTTTTRTTTRITFRTSVVSVQEAYRRVEQVSRTAGWTGDDTLFDLIEGEAANSAATWNVLQGEPADEVTAETELNATRITDELEAIDPDFDARWRGALFALNPANPDAARHFCTSSRELIDKVLLRAAPDAAVKAQLPSYETTNHGSVARRARIRLCLVRSGRYSPEVHDFVDADLENVVELFGEFNEGTHGSAGHFSIGQLQTIKQRVEDALLFLHEIAR